MTDSSSSRLEQFKGDGLSPDSWSSFKRLIEAWAYLAVLVAVAVGCAIYQVWWPLYPAVGLLGLALWHRRI